MSAVALRSGCGEEGVPKAYQLREMIGADPWYRIERHIIDRLQDE